MGTSAETSGVTAQPDKDKKRREKKEIQITYQGRRTARAGSEQRRKDILEAALRIVVRDGVRGVRHRAVAAEAGVPLSATTYYFKDISDLITDTFTLFVDIGNAKYHDLIEEYQTWLIAALERMYSDPKARDSIISEISLRLVAYVRKQLNDRRDYLLAEQAFKLECLRNDKLRMIADQHTEFLLQDLYSFFTKIGSKAPKVDSILMMEMLSVAEYHGLLQPTEEFDEDWAYDLFSRGMRHMLNDLHETTVSIPG